MPFHVQDRHEGGSSGDRRGEQRNGARARGTWLEVVPPPSKVDTAVEIYRFELFVSGRWTDQLVDCQ